MEHTPGPWEWSIPRMPKHRESRWITAGGLFVAKVYGGTDYISDSKETDANARLIAAAPEMLEALDRLTGEVAAHWGMSEPMLRQELGNTNYSVVAVCIASARQAITKALFKNE